MALEAAKISGKNVRVVSIIDKTLFEKQDEAFRSSIIGSSPRIVVAEAGCRYGWEGYAKKEDLFTLDNFGESGTAAKVAEFFHFTAADFAKVLSR